MGKFVITESERVEILKLHNDYKKSLVSEQDSKFIIPPSLPQNDNELSKFAESVKEKLTKDVQSDITKKKLMSYEVLTPRGEETPKNDVELYNKFLNDLYLPRLKTVTIKYGKDMSPTTAGEWSPKTNSISINPESIYKSSVKQGTNPEEELKRVILHELRHFLYDVLTEIYYIPMSYMDFMWNMNKPIPQVISKNKYPINQYNDPYTYDTSEVMARMEEFRKVLGIKPDETYTPEQMRNIIMSKFKNIFSKYPQLTSEEFNQIKNLPKSKRENPISNTTKEFVINDERGVNISFWYKGSYENFLKDFENYANDISWMMNLITTLKLEGYFYVDYSVASHVQDYFVSVEKGDTKNIG